MWLGVFILTETTIVVSDFKQQQNYVSETFCPYVFWHNIW